MGEYCSVSDLTPAYSPISPHMIMFAQYNVSFHFKYDQLIKTDLFRQSHGNIVGLVPPLFLIFTFLPFIFTSQVLELFIIATDCSCNKHSQTIGLRGRGKFYYTNNNDICILEIASHVPLPSLTIGSFLKKCNTYNMTYNGQSRQKGKNLTLTKVFSVLHDSFKLSFYIEI